MDRASGMQTGADAKRDASAAVGNEGRPEPVSSSPAPGGGQPHSRRQGAIRLAVLALIGVAIWYLQAGRGLPWRSAGDPPTQEGERAGFVSFGAQGVTLGPAGGPAPKRGAPAPDFTLRDLQGNAISLSDFRGKTVVLNFWASWCPPCRKEFPQLVQLARHNADQELVILGVDLQERPELVRRFAADFGASFPIVIDTKGDVAAQYRLLGLPATFFIDREGVLRGQHRGELTEGILTTKLGEAGFAVSRSQ